MPVAPAIAVPSRSHATLVDGAGTPLQLPAETVTGSPIRPVPARTGARTRTGGTILTDTVAAKETRALPPEFVAVTVTVALPAAVAGTLTRPFASTVAPPPSTAKTRALPAKAAAASTTAGASPTKSPRSASGATTVGAAWTIARAAVSAEAAPAAFVAVTRAERRLPSSAATGV